MLCGAFDAVRFEMHEQSKEAEIPVGFELTREHRHCQIEPKCMVNNSINWSHKTCRMDSILIVDALLVLRKQGVFLATAKQLESVVLQRISNSNTAKIIDLLETWGVCKLEALPAEVDASEVAIPGAARAKRKLRSVLTIRGGSKFD